MKLLPPANRQGIHSSNSARGYARIAETLQARHRTSFVVEPVLGIYTVYRYIMYMKHYETT